MSTFRIVLALTTFFTFQSAFACSCEDWTSVREMLRQGQAVFIGIPTMNSKKVPGATEDEMNQVTTMSVVRGYKNVSVKKLSLYTQKPDGGNCGMNFENHKGAYLVVAYKDRSGRLMTDGCSLRGIHHDDKTTARLITELNSL